MPWEGSRKSAKCVEQQPVKPLIEDERYAYFSEVPR
jgi:hypothetical protein